MPIESGHYIITNVKQRRVALLNNSYDATPLVAYHYFKHGNLSNQWRVKALSNGRHLIINLKHNRRAVTKPRAAPGEGVKGGNEDYQWRIRETNYRGGYTISTIDTGCFWGLKDDDINNAITLLDRPFDARCRWIFQKIGSCDDSDEDLDLVTEARNLEEQEMAKWEEADAELPRARYLVQHETHRREKAEAEVAVARECAEQETRKGEKAEPAQAVARDHAEQEMAKRKKAEMEGSMKAAELAVMKQEAAAAKAEVAKKANEVETAKEDAADARREAAAEMNKRKDAEAEVARKTEEVAQVKAWVVRTLAELEAARQDAAAAKAVAAEEATKRRGAEAEAFSKAAEAGKAQREAAQANAEASSKAAEVKQAKQEAAQAKQELLRILAELEAGRRDAAAAKAVAAEDAAKRNVMKLEVSRVTAEMEEAKREAAQLKVEASRKTAEVDQTAREVAQTKEELARNRAYIKSFIIPQLDTGRYTITNVGSKNVATLGEVHTESYLTGGLKQDRDSEKWGIVLLSNDKYTIKSVATGLYANYEPSPRKGEFVFGSSRPQQWKIKAMWSPGHYVIFPANAHCYWSLPDGEEGTPIVFSDHENGPKNQWLFTVVV